jgi:hypothetical protein
MKSKKSFQDASPARALILTVLGGFGLVVATNGQAAKFDEVLPGKRESVSPEDMSFDSGRFIYSDDFQLLSKGLGVGAVKSRSFCEDRKWDIRKDNELNQRVCSNPRVESIPSDERAKRLENAKYILSHISEGSLPAGVRPENLVVGKNLPYSGDWYPYYRGGTLSNPNGTLLNRKKYQRRSVYSYGPTSSEILKWNRKGTLAKELAKFPMPILVDILNGKTDPKKSDFYAFTRSEQDRLNDERSDFTRSHGGVFSAVKFKTWAWHGMCESWSASAINEPIPKSYRVRKKITSGNSSGVIELNISAETFAAANAVAYNRFMFNEMEPDDPMNNTPELQERARALSAHGYRTIGKKCRLKDPERVEWLQSIQFSPARVSKNLDDAGKDCMDLNFGLLTIVAMNKIGVYADLFFADFDSAKGVWHYPVAGAYLEDLGAVQSLDADRAPGTRSQRRVNLYLIRAKTHRAVSKGDYVAEKYPGRLDLTENDRIIGGRFTTTKMLDYLVDVRRPILEGSHLGVMKWIEEHATDRGQILEVPDLAVNR